MTATTGYSTQMVSTKLHSFYTIECPGH